RPSHMNAKAEADLPTLLMLGKGDPMHAALLDAVHRYFSGVTVGHVDEASALAATSAPDLVFLLGDAASEAGKVVHALAASPLTAGLPVVVLSSTGDLADKLL